jgi:hypothetical protein
MNRTSSTLGKCFFPQIGEFQESLPMNREEESMEIHPQKTVALLGP